MSPLSIIKIVVVGDAQDGLIWIFLTGVGCPLCICRVPIRGECTGGGQANDAWGTI